MATTRTGKCSDLAVPNPEEWRRWQTGVRERKQMNGDTFDALVESFDQGPSRRLLLGSALLGALGFVGVGEAKRKHKHKKKKKKKKHNNNDNRNPTPNCATPCTSTICGTFPVGCTLFPADNIWNRRIDSPRYRSTPVPPTTSTPSAETPDCTLTSAPASTTVGQSASPSPTSATANPASPSASTTPTRAIPAPTRFPATLPSKVAPAVPATATFSSSMPTPASSTSSTTPHRKGSGWRAGSGAIFDLRSNALRPAGWTSADAAGLPILPGLVRYEEVAAGVINHALRFTADVTRDDLRLAGAP